MNKEQRLGLVIFGIALAALALLLFFDTPAPIRSAWDSIGGGKANCFVFGSVKESGGGGKTGIEALGNLIRRRVSAENMAACRNWAEELCRETIQGKNYTPENLKGRFVNGNGDESPFEIDPQCFVRFLR